ncbi:MAG: hypothetical protein GXO87_07195 [Chlorobi bacterium]|nr:hypothetical protein [Chlorobiota bacterium]
MDKKNIIENISGVVEREGFLPVEVIIRGDQRKPVIEVFIDSGKNITAEDCARMSSKINSMFEDENLFKGNYRLDVSSPGVERPLKFIEQFPKNVGRKFEIVYKPKEIEEKFNGKLIKAAGNELTFSVGKTEQIISFEDIVKAKVLISF